ncbi:MAG: wax ester/triacylglycerol synthase domain-containing protein [Acidimicrobiales bacterium]
MAARERDIDLSDRMSEHEALMWNIEKDPWLNPNGASLTLLDQPVDMDRFRRQLRWGISRMPRLYQRVVPGLGRFSTPAWAPDPEFDFDYHVREVELPGPGTRRELFDLAARLYEEPLDRTRPLWRFVAISGIEGGRGAVWAETHHAIADGIGQLRMAELYQQLNRDDQPSAEVDLDAVIAEALERHEAKQSGGDLASSLASTATSTVGHLARRQAGVSRRVAGELMLWPADPGRVAERAGDIVATVRSTGGLLSSPSEEDRGGSPLWRDRSRHRRLEYVRVPLDRLKVAAKALGGSVNDAFMIGLTEGAARYHAERDVVVDKFNTSFIVSTRTDNTMGGNAFTPVMVQVPGRPAGFAQRMKEMRAAVTEARRQSDRSGGMSGLSGVINLLPTSVVTRTARKQASNIDFATSNLRGAPFPLYVAGAKVEATVCMGPLAGTAANATALSYDGHFDIGLFIDPTAIDDGEAYRRCVDDALADLIAEHAPAESDPGSPSPAPSSNGHRAPGPERAETSAKSSRSAKKTARSAKKPTVSKKTASKKTASKKTAAKKSAAKKTAAKG